MRFKLLLSLSILLSGSVPAAELKICVDSNDWSPYTFATHDGTLQLLVRSAAAKRGNSVKYVALPWRRCELEVGNGSIDGMLGATPTPHSLARYAFPLEGGMVDVSRSMVEVEVVLLKRRGDPVAWDGTTLSGLKGSVAYVSTYDEIEGRLRELGIPSSAGFSTEEQNAKALMAKRIDVLASYLNSADLLVRRPEFGGQIEIMSQPIGRFFYYLAFGPHFCESGGNRCEQLWADIAEVRRSVASSR